MITITREVVSRKTSPYKILIHEDKIVKLEETRHRGNLKVQTKIIYAPSSYEEELIYSSDSFNSIVRKIRREQNGHRRSERSGDSTRVCKTCQGFDNEWCKVPSGQVSNSEGGSELASMDRES